MEGVSSKAYWLAKYLLVPKKVDAINCLLKHTLGDASVLRLSFLKGLIEPFAFLGSNALFLAGFDDPFSDPE